MMTTYKKLYRSRTSRVLGGVAGGLAEYLGISPVLTRIGFAALMLFGGGFLIYFLFLVMVPKQPEFTISMDDSDLFDRDDRYPSLIRAMLVALPIAGLSALIAGHWVVFPFVFGLAVGLYYFWKSSGFREKFFVEEMGIYRSTGNRKIAGVFGGLAAKLNVDATLLRIIAVVLLFATGGTPIPIYILYLICVPAVEDQPASRERVIVIQ